MHLSNYSIKSCPPINALLIGRKLKKYCLHKEPAWETLYVWRCFVEVLGMCLFYLKMMNFLNTAIESVAVLNWIITVYDEASYLLKIKMIFREKSSVFCLLSQLSNKVLYIKAKVLHILIYTNTQRILFPILPNST